MSGLAPRQQPTLVVAAIIQNGEKILIAQRRSDAKFEAGKWEFPGGKVEIFESLESALEREIKEELGIDIKAGALFGVVSHVGQSQLGSAIEKKHIVLIAYRCRHVGGEVELLDAADARWVMPNELGAFDFAAADLPLISQMQGDPNFSQTFD